MVFQEGLLKVKVGKALSLLCVLLVQVLGMEKSLSCFKAWDMLSLWALAFGCSGSLARREAFVGLGRCWTHQGLRSLMDGSPLLEAGSHSAMCASWAPASGTL